MERKIEAELKPYKHSDICKLFHYPKSSFNKLIKPYRERLGKRKGYTWSVEQVAILFEILDRPYVIVDE